MNVFLDIVIPFVGAFVLAYGTIYLLGKLIIWAGGILW